NAWRRPLPRLRPGCSAPRRRDGTGPRRSVLASPSRPTACRRAPVPARTGAPPPCPAASAAWRGSAFLWRVAPACAATGGQRHKSGLDAEDSLWLAERRLTGGAGEHSTPGVIGGPVDENPEQHRLVLGA